MTLTETLAAQPPPLMLDSEGVLRVGGTRITLDTILNAYEQGAQPEEIVRRYPSLQLADVHAVISYYLRHGEEVSSYLEEQRRREQATLEQIDARNSSSPLRTLRDVSTPAKRQS
jgi:uncharacterized protein (DUF433 family)